MNVETADECKIKIKIIEKKRKKLALSQKGKTRQMKFRAKLDCAGINQEIQISENCDNGQVKRRIMTSIGISRRTSYA